MDLQLTWRARRRTRAISLLGTALLLLGGVPDLWAAPQPEPSEQPTLPDPDPPAPVPPADVDPEPDPDPDPDPDPHPEPDPEPEQAPDPEPELTPEELAEIEAALGADAATSPDSAEATSTPAPTLAPTQPPTAAATAAALLPNISVILDVASAVFSDDDNLQGGAHDPNSTGFNLQQLELSINKSVDPYFRFDSNIVFSLFGVEVEEAYATTIDMPWNLQVRAGQFLTRFGRINPTHPHSWDFVDQPFIMSKVWGGE
ncbi:MAG: hypothetical protein RIF41_27840, partial [Polyangiaceae bacterium]